VPNRATADPNDKKLAERSSLRLQRFVEATRSRSDKRDPRIWLTETGAQFHQHRDPAYDAFGPAEAEQAANADLAYLLTLPYKEFVTDRITRVWVYQWIGSAECGHGRPACPQGVTDEYPFDAGLLDANDADRPPRSLYSTYKGKANP